MKTLKELQKFAEELSSADRIICDALADGTYRLGELKFSELVSGMLRSVFNDMVGHQETIDLSIFDGFDPQDYLRVYAGEDEGFPEVVSSLFDTERSREALKLMETERYRLYEELIKKVKSSLVFCAYTLASRRDRLRIAEKKEEAKMLIFDMLGDKTEKYPEGDVILTGFALMGFLPTNSFEHTEIIFNKNRYRAYESKLILEIPYAEFLANLLEGKIERDHLGFLGILTEEDARYVMESLKGIEDEELREDLKRYIKDWRFYRFTDFGISICYAQGALYTKENADTALDYLKRLEPKTKLENLLAGRAWENLGRNLEDRSFLKIASDHYQKAGNIVKAMECEVL
ncbi:MAG: hypothetical protein QW212_00085 [Nitrososphaerales archaeon]